MLCIANIAIPSRLILASLTGITDLPFRTVAREFGCEFAFLEMLNARSMSYKNRKIKELLKSSDFDKPLGAQLLGTDIAYLIKAAKFLEKSGVSLIDFNAACPVKKVVKRGEGAALLKYPKKLKIILKALVENLSIPVSVKIRSGWDEHDENAVEIARTIEKSGVSALFIHGRHRSQQNKGNVSYEIIRKVKQSVGLPVIASGNILSALAAKRMFEETNCDGVLIARGAIGRPWIFREVSELLNGKGEAALLSIAEIKEVIFRHISLAIENYGEKIAMVKMRKILPSYIKSFKGAKEVRMKLNQIKSEKDLKAILEGF